MKKVIKRVLLLLLVVFIGMQFFRPEKNVSDIVPATDFITVTNPPAEIESMLRTSCYDCHSNNTVYPWYSNLAPVSYWLDEHIMNGKRHLNFSQWETYTPKKKAHKLEELVEEVEKHAMPLDSYLWIHKDAELSGDQIKQLTDWANDVRFIYQIKPK